MTPKKTDDNWQIILILVVAILLLWAGCPR